MIASACNDPRRVAIDLLAQAEHDEAAQSILITDDAVFADAVVDAVAAAVPTLSRSVIAGASWAAHGAVILVRDWTEAVVLVDRLAPEHLQLMGREPEERYSTSSAPRRRDLPGHVLSGGGGRLRGGPEPRASDRPHGTIRLGTIGVRFPETHDMDVGRSGGIATHRAGGGHPGGSRGNEGTRPLGGDAAGLTVRPPRG